GHRGARQAVLVVPELEDAGNRETLWVDSEERDLGLVAEFELAVLERLEVERDLRRVPRLTALLEIEGLVHRRLARIPARSERRRLVLDRLAVFAFDEREPDHAPLRAVYAAHVLHDADERFRNGHPRRRRALTFFVERFRRAHDRVHTLRRVGEQ